MKKSILNLGQSLSKNDQKQINGGDETHRCNEGQQALVGCINGFLIGYCRNNSGSIYTISFGLCF